MEPGAGTSVPPVLEPPEVLPPEVELVVPPEVEVVLPPEVDVPPPEVDVVLPPEVELVVPPEVELVVPPEVEELLPGVEDLQDFDHQAHFDDLDDLKKNAFASVGVTATTDVVATAALRIAALVSLRYSIFYPKNELTIGRILPGAN